MILQDFFDLRMLNPTPADIRRAVNRVWGVEPNGVLILDDTSDRGGGYCQICYDHDYGGFCVEVQRPMPLPCFFRLKHPASAAEAARLLTAFILHSVSIVNATEWSNVTEEIFGPPSDFMSCHL